MRDDHMQVQKSCLSNFFCFRIRTFNFVSQNEDCNFYNCPEQNFVSNKSMETLNKQFLEIQSKLLYENIETGSKITV